MFADDANSTRAVAENSAEGTDVGRPVDAIDPDDDILTYALEGADAESFDIDSVTGQISVGGGTALDPGRQRRSTPSLSRPPALPAPSAEHHRDHHGDRLAHAI